MEILVHLVHLVATVWRADSEIRDSSLIGESPADRKSRKWVGILSVLPILALLLVAAAWIWISL